MTQKHATQTIKEGLADALDELEDPDRNGKKPTLNGQWLGALGEHLVAKAYRATHAGHRVEQYDLEFGAENIEVMSPMSGSKRWVPIFGSERCTFVRVASRAIGRTIRKTLVSAKRIAGIYFRRQTVL
jgi:hypothetical protein